MDVGYFAFLYFIIINSDGNVKCTFCVLGAILATVSVLTLSDYVFLTEGKKFKCPGCLFIDISGETLIPIVEACPMPTIGVRSNTTVSINPFMQHNYERKRILRRGNTSNNTLVHYLVMNMNATNSPLHCGESTNAKLAHTIS